MKTCLYLTDDGQKIMFDDDHFTLSGSKFLGKKCNLFFYLINDVCAALKQEPNYI